MTTPQRLIDIMAERSVGVYYLCSTISPAIVTECTVSALGCMFHLNSLNSRIILIALRLLPHQGSKTKKKRREKKRSSRAAATTGIT